MTNTNTTRPHRHRATRFHPDAEFGFDESVIEEFEAEFGADTGDIDESAAGGLIDRLGAHVRDVVADPVSHWDPDYIEETLLPVMAKVNGYFGGELDGLDHVPADRPVLLVGNHSGGILSPDTGILLENWYRHFGGSRQLALLTFDLAMAIPGFGDLCRKLGSVPAGHDAAETALASGASVLVYPGGDHEVYRPFWHRNHVDFGGRSGFVRLALRTGTPIVPVVGHGGHNTMAVLARGDRLAERMGLDRVRTKVFPFALSPFGVVPAWLSLPLPAKVQVKVLEPIDLSAFGPAAADDDEVVAHCYDLVTGRMQAALTAMAKDTPFPVLSRIGSLFGRS